MGTELETIRVELLALTALHKRVVEGNDLVGRLFASLRNDETPPPTYAELDIAVKELEKKVPGFYVWYYPEEKTYGLFPEAGYTPTPETESREEE